MTDFEDELVEVKEPMFKHLRKQAITVILDEEHYALLNSVAEQEHLNANTLVNEWIIHLIEEKSFDSSATAGIHAQNLAAASETTGIEKDDTEEISPIADHTSSGHLSWREGVAVWGSIL